MAYRVLDNVTNIFHDYDTFREAYDACVNDDNKTTISFNDMDWKWKTKKEIWVNEDHLENLSEEYRNEQEQDVGYWVCSDKCPKSQRNSRFEIPFGYLGG